jgi:hypothetical protein
MELIIDQKRVCRKWRPTEAWQVWHLTPSPKPTAQLPTDNSGYRLEIILDRRIWDRRQTERGIENMDGGEQRGYNVTKENIYDSKWEATPKLNSKNPLVWKVRMDCLHNLFAWSLVKALCYKPEGHGFDTRWGEFLNLSNPSGRTRSWGLLSL